MHSIFVRTKPVWGGMSASRDEGCEHIGKCEPPTTCDMEVCGCSIASKVRLPHHIQNNHVQEQQQFSGAPGIPPAPPPILRNAGR
mmetsp:Transcript_95582/g.160535  ORF Transcript_95582/g.160535 Transcript_95582/m.160535 type:complete len:85 (+) Transcript_95582:2271-2525(+)